MNLKRKNRTYDRDGCLPSVCFTRYAASYNGCSPNITFPKAIGLNNYVHWESGTRWIYLLIPL